MGPAQPTRGWCEVPQTGVRAGMWPRCREWTWGILPGGFCGKVSSDGRWWKWHLQDVVMQYCPWLVFGIYKELLKSNNKNNKLVKKGAKNLDRCLTRKGIQLASEHTKRSFTSLVIREMQIKTMRYHYTAIGMAKIQNTYITNCRQRCGATETLIYCRWKCEMAQPP